MKTEDILNRIIDLKSERERLTEEYIAPLDKEISALEKDRIKSIISNKEFLTDLSDYNGKYLWSITALNSDGGEVDIPTDEIVEVESGRLYCSSSAGGIVSWSYSENCYMHSFHGSYKKLDILGFIDIKVEQEDF